MNTIELTLKNKYKYDFEHICEYVLNSYRIYDIHLQIVEDNKLVDKLSTENLTLDAILIHPINNMYTLFVRNGKLAPILLCHELVHLKQYYFNELEMMDDYKTYKWMGKEYDSSTSYEDRPWENDAFKHQNVLWRLYKKYNNIK